MKELLEIIKQALEMNEVIITIKGPAGSGKNYYANQIKTLIDNEKVFDLETKVYDHDMGEKKPVNYKGLLFDVVAK